MTRPFRPLAAAMVGAALLSTPALAADIPHLAAQGTTKQLVVDGKPFLILGGELANSTASSLDYLNSKWPTLKSVGLNTVIAPVEWVGADGRTGRRAGGTCRWNPGQCRRSTCRRERSRSKRFA